MSMLNGTMAHRAPPDWPPDYRPVGNSRVLRALSPLEWNMERLNRTSRGAGTVVQVALLRNAPTFDEADSALEQLTVEHPLLSARVAQADDRLFFVHEPGATTLSRQSGEHPGRAWLDEVESLVNRGPLPTWNAPSFQAKILCSEDSNAQAWILLGPHSMCDGISLASLMTQWLELATGEAPPARPRELVSHASPFSGAPAEDKAAADAEAQASQASLLRQLEAWRTAENSERERTRAELLDAVRGLEAMLRALGTGDTALPSELLAVRGWIDELTGWAPAYSHLIADTDLDESRPRADQVSTGVSSHELDALTTTRLQAACKAHEVTMHGAIGAAVHRAFAARQRDGGQADDLPIRAGSPVNMRPHFANPIEPRDLSMAVEVAFTTVRASGEDDFWSVARTFSESIRDQVKEGRSLAAWHRSVPRDRHEPSGGVPLMLVSNMGRSAFRERYGSTEVLEIATVMATHGMFQIDMLWQTFRGKLSVCFYWERPTVSDASMARFAERALAGLSHAAGTSPSVPGPCP